MSQLIEGKEQWIKQVERNCSEGKLDTVIPQIALSLDDAIHLAIRLDVSLNLIGETYVFQCPRKPKINKDANVGNHGG